MNPAQCAAVVTAAGASLRMATAGKKEYRSLQGLPVLARALLPFVSSDLFFRVVVTVPPAQIENVRLLLAPYAPLGNVIFVEGGSTRQASVRLALRALAESAPSFVLIHDGARPWVGADLVRAVLECTRESGSCVPCLEASEAIKEIDDGTSIVRHLDRSRLRCAQTPQGFRFESILSAHEQAQTEAVTCSDDAELYDRYIGRVSWIPGAPENRKITWPHDLGGA